MLMFAEPTAPLAPLTTTVPVYVLAFNAEGFTLTVTEPGVTPEVGEAESQLPPLTALTATENFRPSALPVTVIAAEGASPPAWQAKFRLVGDALTVGAA
jgi:hypothetical protein